MNVLFVYGRMLWLLAIGVPSLAIFFVWSWRKRQRLTAQFVQSRLLANLTIGVSKGVLKARMVLLVLATTLLLLTLARPLWGEVAEEVRQRGLDIVVAIDTSRSMLAEDVAPNRLERSKLAALDLMRLAKNDRLGLVAFAGTAFLQCPLTLDEGAFRQSVAALEVGIIPQGGSSLAEAIEASLTAFKEETENFKILVLFTDGEDHETGAAEAAKKAERAGMRIFTVGIGTANGELLRVRDEKGNWEFIKDDKGNAVKSRLNETLLTEIATATQGFYLGMSGANTIDILYRQGLAPLPKSETTTRMLRHHKEQFMWPLSLAILVLLMELFWPERRRAARPATTAVASANEALRKAVALLAFALLNTDAFASSNSALRQYEQGRFDEAHQEFKKLTEKNPGDARLQFNAGAAAYQAKEYEEAAKHFMSAINPENLDLQQSAHYNLGNARFRLGEQQDNPQEKAASWEGAAQDYESALKLNPQDGDARFNLDLVKKKLEELQQQQKQDKDKSGDKSKDDKDQQKQDKDQDQKQDEEKNKDQQPKEQPQEKSEEEKQQDQKQQQSEQDKEQKDEQSKSAQNNDKPEKKEGDEEKKSNPGENQPDKGEQEAGQAAATPRQMTKEQVEKLLDAQKSYEKAMIFQPPEKARNKARIYKDW